MDISQVEAVTGQLVRIGCKVTTGTITLNFCLFSKIFFSLDDPTVEILWFIKNKQIKDSGRTPIKRRNSEVWLQIFDCVAAEDTGPIICLAIGESGVVSDVCSLVVKGNSYMFLQ